MNNDNEKKILDKDLDQVNGGTAVPERKTGKTGGAIYNQDGSKRDLDRDYGRDWDL